MEYIKLSDISTIIMGQSPNSDTYNEIGEGVPFFQGKADFGRVNPKVRMYCSKPTKLAEVSDILMSVRAPVGDVNIANEQCCIGRGLCAIRGSIDINNKFLYYYLITMKEELNSKATGSTFKAINKSILEEVTIPNISIDKQNNIVKVLDKAQELIDKRREQIEDLDKLIKSKFIEMFGDPFNDEKGFGTNKLGEVTEINPKKAEIKDLDKELLVSFVPMDRVGEKGEFNPEVSKSIGEVYSGFTYFRENDVLFAKITPCMENGKGAVAVNLSNGIGFGSTEFHVLRPLREKSNSYWIYHLTTLIEFRRLAERKMTGSAGQKRVPTDFLNNIQVVVPPIELQNQFADFVKKTDKLKFEMVKSLKELEDNFSSLMQKAFKGELF